MDMLVLHRAKCRHETSSFGNVGGSSGGSRLGETLLDLTVSRLRLALAEIHDVDDGHFEQSNI